MEILIADDHDMVREGIATLLAQLETAPLVHHASSYEEGLSIALNNSLGLTLLDLNMPGMDGTEGVTRMLKEVPDTPILVLSGTDSPHVIRRCINAGAQGYVIKSADSHELLKAIQSVLDGQRYMPELELDEPSYKALSPRQEEVLKLIAEGMSNKAIADKLHISDGTVKQHLHAIFNALGVKNRTHAVQKARELGIIF